VDERGRHTLRVMRGTIVGAHGRDVFVELGPRLQGVICRDPFMAEPREGASYGFTLMEEGSEDVEERLERSLVICRATLGEEHDLTRLCKETLEELPFRD